jgi:NAD+ kinase
MRIGIHGRLYPAAAAHTVAHILGRVVAAGAVPVVEVGLATRMAEAGVPLTSDMHTMTAPAKEQLDLLISLGGDGSFLDSVAFVGGSGVPMLGINLGRLGFLSNTRIEDVDDTLKAVIQGRFTIVERGLLAMRGLEEFDGRTALNEVSLHKRDGATMIAIHAHLDGHFLNTYWADGLIISTPTGSTAYSLSCGGPIVAPDCDAMVVTPISPHNLNVRPFVVPWSSELTLTVDARSEKYLVNMDSRSRILDHKVELRVCRAEHRAKIVQLEGQAFLDTLRSKLGWGLDIRSAKPGFQQG